MASPDDFVVAMSSELLAVKERDLAQTIHAGLERPARVVNADRAYVLKTSVEGGQARFVLDRRRPRHVARFWFAAIGYTRLGGAGSYGLLVDDPGQQPKHLLRRVDATEVDSKPSALSSARLM